jgi:high affinity sulfate transporter 1
VEKRRLSAITLLPAWARLYSGKNFNVDLVAGLSLAAFVIPESLAYASLAQLPPVTGLYCYLVAGIAYALFGTSRQLAVGPTSALAIVVAAGVATISGDPSRFVALASAIALLVGLVSIGGRYIGLANAAYFISDPILVGFKTGAAFYIASTQLPKVFDVQGITGNFFERVGHVIALLPETHVVSLLFGCAAIALFIVLERALPSRPTTLMVVVVSIVVMSVFSLAETGIKIVGELPRGLPIPTLPDVQLSDISTLLPIALACFLLAYGEGISVARSFAQKHGYDIDPEQELTALGAANIATGLAHGFPVAGGMSQTAVNDMGGASSPAALIVTAGAVALTLIFFAPLFHNLPEPVLAAIVLMAATHLIRIHDLRALRYASRREFLIALLAMIGVLFLGLLNGLLLAAAGSLMMLIANASRPAVARLGRDPVTGRFVDEARNQGTIGPPGSLVVRSAGGWLYFNAEHIRRSIMTMVEAATPGTNRVVIDFSIVPVVDITAAATLCALVRTLRARHIEIALAELHDDVAERLRTAGTEGDLGPIVAHRTVDECLATSEVTGSPLSVPHESA